MANGSAAGTSPDDELVESVTTYVPRPLLLHGYVYPFIILYAVWACIWTSWLAELENSVEAGSIGTAVIFIVQTLIYLFCHWSVHIHCYLTCNQENDPKKATLAKVVPTPTNGSPELVRLFKSQTEDIQLIWFMFQECKYEWDFDAKSFQALVYPLGYRLKTYLNHKGYQDESQIQQADKKFGKNKTKMRIPSFHELFIERATAPFFVFQVFCVLLWCLDEYWMYSVFTLAMLVVFECTLVQQQLRNMSEIRNMGNKGYNIQVYRNRKWRATNSEELLPGDIVSICRSQHEEMIPCDMLLLRGPCIVDESMLTGESIPQMKEPIESEFVEGVNDVSSSDRYLDTATDGKLRILFGGTKVVQHTPPTKTATALRAPDNGCVCYVLRTGFSTSQGKLLRTILYGVKRVTANNLETFAFILFLLIFAIAAASYVWIKGSADPDRNRYKLFLECTLILTSVVPPELPIELSLAVNSSVLSLTKLGVYCTEPFRIPFAGKIDICCFDKTGTLTSDNLVIEGVATKLTGVKSKPDPLSALPVDTIQCLASCHSLVTLEDGDIVGDPLEKVTLKWIDWDINKEVVMPKKQSSATVSGLRGIKIFHRFHFSSALKRMSVISGYTAADSLNTEYIATVKGAPEIMKPMFANPPENYDEIYQSYTRRGARVLALGIKKLGRMASTDIRKLSRDDIESELSFQGFLIVSCPLKPDSKGVIQEIMNSSHRVVMITGDSPLTACHVAKQLKMVKSDSILIFNPDTMNWESIDEKIKIQYESLDQKSFEKGYDLCLSGDGITKLITYQEKDLVSRLSRLLPFITIFARMAPKQKEWVINSIKSRGYHTLMCGDGTNDVGALKHSHVGVAILSSCPEWMEKKKKLMLEIQEKKDNLNNSNSNSNNVGSTSSPSSVVRRTAGGPRRSLPPVRGAGAGGADANSPDRQWMKMIKEIEDEEKAQVVKLGDASIAAPFSSKMSSIECICHIIKQGRCTLVTTLQMFKILALNALILAYSQSVLYLDGIKLSDTQATFHGLLLAACFFFISHSKPLKTLSRNRPIPNIFNAYTLLTVLLQFCVHFYVMVSVVRKSLEYAPEDLPEKVDLEKKFAPSLLNSTVYVVSLALQLSTFVVNYRGHPYMESISENRPFFYSIIFSTSMVFVILANIMPDLNAQFEVIPFPYGLQQEMLVMFIGDIFGCYLIDRSCLYIFGEGKLKIN